MIDDLILLKEKYGVRDVTDIVIKYVKIKEHLRTTDKGHSIEYYNQQTLLRVENYLKAHYKRVK